MQESGSLRVVPDKVEFKGVIPGQTSVYDVWIHNIGKKPVRIRYSIPINPFFTLQADSSQMLPSGLETKVSIRYFASNVNEIQQSNLKISTPDTNINIPITAHPPTPSFTFNKTTIDLGIVSPQMGANASFYIINNGTSRGSFAMKSDDPSITLIPALGELKPRENKEIKLEFKPTSAKPHNMQVYAFLNGTNMRTPAINISANVVEHELSIMVDNKEVKEINFGHIYYGQKKIVQLTIKNKSAIKRSFVILPPHDPNSPSAMLSTTRTPSTILDPDVIFTAIPCEGSLKPYSSTTISIVFAPPNNAEDEQMYNHLTSITTVETKQQVDIQLSGTSVNPNYTFSAIDFDFGRQKVGTKAHQELIIYNKSTLLPIAYEMKKTAHFNFLPANGTIKPMESKIIKIVFSPKNLGEFKTSAYVDICQGYAKKKINLVAVAVAKDIEIKKFTRTPIWETDETALYNAYHPNKWGMGMDEIRKHGEMRKEFDGYLATSARKRKEITTKRQALSRAEKDAQSYVSHSTNPISDADMQEYILNRLKRYEPDDPVDLGIDNLEMLNPPNPPVLKGHDKFVIPDPSKLGLIVSTPRSKSQLAKKQNDEKVMIATKFKSRPTTPPEIIECGRTLSPAQLMSILASHQTMNFGIVSVMSHEKRSFELTNQLEQHVLVSMSYDNIELKGSMPNSQVIPPHQTAGFDIDFTSQKSQNFLSAIKYVINNVHEFSFNVCAQVIEINVKLSRSLIKFEYKEEMKTPYIREHLEIQNTSNAVVDYKWNIQSQHFTIKPENGLIQPEESAVCEVTFIPKSNPRADTKAILAVKGGQNHALNLIGDIGKPKVVVNKTQLNFGLFPIEIQQTMSFQLKNVGSDSTFFNAAFSSEQIISVVPDCGSIKPNEIINVNVTIIITRSGAFDLPLNIFVCGGPTIFLNLTGLAEVPQIEFSYPNLTFGKLFIGCTDSREIILRNIGKIPAIIFIDLTDYPQFNIKFPAELGLAPDNGETNSVLLVTDDNQRTETTNTQSLLDIDTFDLDNMKYGFIYKITIMPKTTIELNFVFQPRKPGKFDFDIPISIMHIRDDQINIDAHVKGESVHAPLLPSVSSIDFGVGSLYTPENPSNSPKIQKIELTNESTIPINFKFEPNSDVFTVKPTTGRIDYCSKITVFISFKPMKPLPYTYLMPLYVLTDAGPNLISKLQLTGVGTSRTFKTSTDYVCLPATPLGIKVEKLIYILNTSSTNTAFNVQIPISEKNFPLTVTFPEGKKMLCTQPRIPLLVSFVSDKPMSFSTVVAIVNKDGNSYSFTVSATCDNSLFTLYPFIESGNYELDGQGGGPIMASLINKEVEEDFFSRLLSVPDIISIAEMKARTPRNVERFVINFLNSLVLNTTITQFPDDLIDYNWSVMMEIIANMSGRSPSLKTPPSPLSSRSTKSVKVENQSKYDEMKNFLQNLMSQGAFLSIIKPEFLLPQTEYIDFMRKKITKTLLGLDYYGAPDIDSIDQDLLNEFTSTQSFSLALIPRLKAAENLYKPISHESWLYVIFQCIKIFYMTKISFENFNTTPGVQEALDILKENMTPMAFHEINRLNKSLISSNIFSSIESLLLKWISINFSKVNTTDITAFMDFMELKDPLVLISLFKAHLPNTMLQTKEEDMKQVIEYLQKVKSSFIPSVNEIAEGNCCTLALLASHMYLILPNFIPSSTITFKAQLNQKSVQSVTVSNPSSTKKITYKATLEGSNNFSLIQDTVTLMPNETIEFKVEFFARKHSDESATLTMTPGKPMPIDMFDIPASARKPQSTLLSSRKAPSALSARPKTARPSSQAPAFASTIIIQLTASVTIKDPIEKIEIESPLYVVSKQNFKIKNFVQKPGTFQVFTRFYQLTDEDGKALRNKNITKQMKEFLDDPRAVPAFITQKTQYETQVQNHQAFIFMEKEITFESGSSVIELESEFIPISLGLYRCLILFINNEIGEFMYEIQANATRPEPTTPPMSVHVESGKSKTQNIDIEILNKPLCQSLAYSMTKLTSLVSYMSDRKFNDLLMFHTREIQALYIQAFISTTFRVECSSEYFKATSEFIINKSQQLSHLPVTFKPTDPGNYPCKVIIISDYDVRVFHIEGTGLMATKSMAIEIKAIAGKSVLQELPFNNPSTSKWNFTTFISGDSHFQTSPNFQVAPGTTYQLPLTFSSNDIGAYDAVLTVNNRTKEIIVRYLLHAVSEEPPSEGAINLSFRAREPFKHKFQPNLFITNRKALVTTTVPVIQCPEEVYFGDEPFDFEFSAYAVRSGITAGAITFRDTETSKSIWYCIEIEVTAPEPEEIIEVSTTMRQSATIKIPVHNPRNSEIEFEVFYYEDDLFGAKTVKVAGGKTEIYELVYSPLNEMRRTSFISFVNEEEGEFVYLLKLTATPPDLHTIAPLISPVGKYASSFIVLENPLKRTIYFKVDNENPNSFQIMEKPMFMIGPNGKKSLEVRYIPSSIGIKESSLLTLKSNDVGDWYYKLTGSGKPPQPLSPVIAESNIGIATSGCIEFINPFITQTKFQVTLSGATNAFKLLSKCRTFTLSAYGEKHQVVFSFNPDQVQQYQADIVVTNVGSTEIRWVFPIIGKTIVGSKTKIPGLIGVANEIIENTVQFPLVAESDKLNLSDYKFEIVYPTGYEWLIKILDVKPQRLIYIDDTPTIEVYLKIAPRRPIEKAIIVNVTNLLMQKWTFNVDIMITKSEPMQKLYVESQLKQESRVKIALREMFKERTAYHAYFASGSAQEFSVDVPQGYIESSLEEINELPFCIVFEPKIYGKVLEGLLVIDTLEAQYLFEVCGKIPDFNLPAGLKSKLNTKMPKSARNADQGKKRNIIRDNIESVRNKGPESYRKLGSDNIRKQSGTSRASSRSIQIRKT